VFQTFHLMAELTAGNRLGRGRRARIEQCRAAIAGGDVATKDVEAPRIQLRSKTA
jgi:hypothetical protein